jgi:hypothetical protein
MAKSKQAETMSERAVGFYHDAREALNAFLADKEIRDILLEFEDLVSEHNAKLDAAIRAVKNDLSHMDQDKLVINGIGAQKKYKRYYDAEFLANALPADQADEILTEKVVYGLDKERLEQLMRQGEIDNDIVQKAYHEEEQNPANLPGNPKPYMLPGIPVTE